MDWYPITIPCNYCENKGHIEIDSPLHKRHKRDKILEACWKYLPKGYDIPFKLLDAQVTNLVTFLEEEKVPEQQGDEDE